MSNAKLFGQPAAKDLCDSFSVVGTTTDGYSFTGTVKESPLSLDWDDVLLSVAVQKEVATSTTARKGTLKEVKVKGKRPGHAILGGLADAENPETETELIKIVEDAKRNAGIV